MRIRGTALSIALLGALLLAACGQAGAGATAVPAATTAPAPQSEATAPAAEPAAGAIRVGSKNFTEMYIMGELYAQLLEANGFTVERTFDLGATPVAHGAITQGDIDLYLWGEGRHVPVRVVTT